MRKNYGRWVGDIADALATRPSRTWVTMPNLVNFISNGASIGSFVKNGLIVSRISKSSKSVIK